MKTIFLLACLLSFLGARNVSAQQSLDDNFYGWQYIHGNGDNMPQAEIRAPIIGKPFIVQIKNPMVDVVLLGYGGDETKLETDKQKFFYISDNPIRIVSPRGVVIYRFVYLDKECKDSNEKTHEIIN